MPKKILTVFFVFICFSFFCGRIYAENFEEEGDSLLGVYEGWSYPVVVVQPPEGWKSEQGAAVKWAMRAAEREISFNREAIGGKEVTFMFSSAARPEELADRIDGWRAMGVSAIVSFADTSMNQALAYLCRNEGPSVIYAAGEDLAILDPFSRRPYPYLFAFDLPYFAKANALAELALQEIPQKKVAVISDIMSEKLAKGAEQNVRFLKARKLEALDISVAGFRQDQFVPQIRDFESGGYSVFSVWLDAMATLSIWKTAYMNRNGSNVYYAGAMHRILLDAEGLLIVDKDVLLERNERGKDDIIRTVRDLFNRELSAPVLAAKAYALARWAISAYAETGTSDKTAIAAALSESSRIPLMDDFINIDPATHRPVSRKFGVLRVENRAYKSYGSVEVFSREVEE